MDAGGRATQEQLPREPGMASASHPCDLDSGNPCRNDAYPIKTAFVSTNSITQGEQVGVLWPDLLKKGVKIHFAHRTFHWSSEAKGKAAVHCVIVGFALHDTTDKRIFDYETLKSEPHENKAKNINPYLVDAPNVVLSNRSKPLCPAPEMVNGSKPTDGGNLLLSSSEKSELLALEPSAAKWIRPYAMSDEFINGIERYCLWLLNCPPQTLKTLPLVLKRIDAVRSMRQSSKDAQTKKDAATPMLFQKIRQPDSDYLAIPRVSSERRSYIPVAFAASNLIAGETLQTILNATLYHFGILQSTMHMAWMRSVCGRLKSDYRYSAGIVYNNFPWPQIPAIEQIPLNPPFSKGESVIASYLLRQLPCPANKLCRMISCQRGIGHR